MAVTRAGEHVVKTLLDASSAAREFRVLKLFHHPNICTAVHVDGTKLVMPYGGPDLLDNLPKDRESLKNVFAQVTTAVAYLHALGFAHLDLKPDNIVCDAQQHVRLIDFGLATNRDELKIPVGTRAYMAPELWLGRPYHPRKADVWSLGMVLFVLVHHKHPFHKAADDDPLYQAFVAQGVSEQDPWLRAVYDKTLCIDPSERGTAADVEEAAACTQPLPPAKRAKML